MKRLFCIDLKRLLQNKAAVIFTITVPVFLALLLSLLLAPFFFSDTIVEEYYVAVYNEDEHPLTSELLDTIINNNQFDKLTGAVFVDSEKEGLEALENGATAYLHFPKGMQDTVAKDEPVVITYIGNPDMPFEDALLTQAMEAASDLVNFTQNAAIELRDSVAEVAPGVSDEVFRDVARVYFFEVMSRKDAYTKQGEDASPYGGLFPVEYYAAALLVLFTALGGLPIAKTISDDASKGLVHRQLLCGSKPLKILLSKWLSGFVFLFAQFAVMSAGLLIVTKNMSYYAGSFAVLLLAGVLLCSFSSALHILIGLSSKQSQLVSFITVFALAAAGGLFVSRAFMPKLLGDIAGFTPLSLAHRLSVSGLFRIEAGGLLLYAAVLLLFAVITFLIALRRMVRRTL